MKKKLLWVGDAAVPSGFARATHGILDTLRHEFDVTVLGINYRGDPHPYPYPIYSAMPGGDWSGVGRLIFMCDTVHPDVIVIQQDGWNVPAYIEQLRQKSSNGEYLFPEYAGIPVVGSIAIDGKNFTGQWLEGLQHTVFWTQFALDEAYLGSFRGSASVIPLGVDLNIYKPMDKREARLKQGFPKQYLDHFIVGCVNRNQPRKRWDLLIKFFGTWVNDYKIKDAFLFLHVAPTGDKGIQIQPLMNYYGIWDKLVIVEPPAWFGVPEEKLAIEYNCMDVAVSTTQGEGFGLTTLEAMACGVPCILPNWSGLGDWAKDAARMIPCSTTSIGFPFVNVIGGVPDEAPFVEALNDMYTRREIPTGDGFTRDIRTYYRAQALKTARNDRYRWENIGAEFAKVLNSVCEGVAA